MPMLKRINPHNTHCIFRYVRIPRIRMNNVIANVTSEITMMPLMAWPPRFPSS